MKLSWEMCKILLNMYSYCFVYDTMFLYVLDESNLRAVYEDDNDHSKLLIAGACG